MTLLPIHIISGVIAIISGFVAVFAVKGMKFHRKSGIIFVYSMMILGVTGAGLAALQNDLATTVSGSLAFYLVTTALLTVRRRDTASPWLDTAGILVAIAAGILNIKFGVDALNSPDGTLDGVPAGMLFLFAAVALLAAVGDARLMLVGGLRGAHRIARHLWRMCFALFLASGSFFLGQAQVFPKPIRIFPLLAIPALLPLALMLYWLARVLLTQWYRRRAAHFVHTEAGPLNSERSLR